MENHHPQKRRISRNHQRIIAHSYLQKKQRVLYPSSKKALGKGHMIHLWHQFLQLGNVQAIYWYSIHFLGIQSMVLLLKCPKKMKKKLVWLQIHHQHIHLPEEVNDTNDMVYDMGLPMVYPRKMIHKWWLCVISISISSGGYPVVI